MSVQTDIDSDIMGRTRTPGVGQSDIAGAAATSIVTSGLLESVASIEEDYSEDIIPEAAAEMGQGKYPLGRLLVSIVWNLDISCSHSTVLTYIETSWDHLVYSSCVTRYTPTLLKIFSKLV